eukprot:jgi/Botrbrau1/12232/Bobra.0361s0002.1
MSHRAESTRDHNSQTSSSENGSGTEADNANPHLARAPLRWDTAPSAKAADLSTSWISNDAVYDCALRVLCSVFDTDTAFIRVITGDLITLPHVRNNTLDLVQPRRLGSACSLIPLSQDSLLVVEDTSKDERFQGGDADGVLAKGFYVEAPLVTSSGVRLGTLCIGAPEPRKFDDQRGMVLANMAEFVVQKLEKNWGLRQWMTMQRNAMMRSIDGHQKACLFVDVTETPWRVLHMNQAASDQTGLCGQEAMPLWGPFQMKQGHVAMLWDCMQKASEGKPFNICHVRASCWPKSMQRIDPYDFAVRKDRQYNMVFRPAHVDVCKESSPSRKEHAPYMQNSTGLGRGYYFVELEPAKPSKKNASCSTPTPELDERAHGSACSSSMGSSMPSKSDTPIPGLRLGGILSCRANVRVHRGLLGIQKVAVKVIEQSEEVEGVVDSAVLMHVEHPCLAKVLAQEVHHIICRAECGRGGASSLLENQSSFSGAAPGKEVWLVLEWCDSGTLADAVAKGLLRSGSPEGGSSSYTDIAGVLALACDIAHGMAHLHEEGILHGALSAENVLLHTSPERPQGLMAKVADYGLCRHANVQHRLSRHGGAGCISYIPPETFADSKLAEGVDTYAFGVICWEMLAHARAWGGMLHAQIVHAVAIRGSKLEFPRDAYMPLARLAARCLDHDPGKRPSFRVLARELKDMQAQLFPLAAPMLLVAGPSEGKHRNEFGGPLLFQGWG